jgi:hypothetical protein
MATTAPRSAPSGALSRTTRKRFGGIVSISWVAIVLRSIG